jgi:hypothetical protein
MPSTGTPSSNTACGAAVVLLVALAWLPDRMMPLSAEVAHEGVGHVAGVDLAVHMRLAHAAGDELGDLGAEVEDEDFLVLHGGRQEKRQRPEHLLRGFGPGVTAAQSAR